MWMPDIWDVRVAVAFSCTHNHTVTNSMRIDEKLIGMVLILAGLGWLGFSYVSSYLAWKAAPEKTMPFQVEPSVASNRSLASSQRMACEVLTVYDGDTLGCDLNGNGAIEKPTEEIRLLGIDSPEMHYSRKNPTYGSEHPTDEPFAKEASQWLTNQTNHQTVYLEFDLRQNDKYGRTLAFVYATPDDPVSLNQQEVAEGLATILFLGKNRLHETEFQQAETQARQAKKGLWAVPN